ncbi:adenine deaminase C-terminal domain-containing protein [Geomicrobium sp. JCM 19039]|uniref:adenine deaminase C-terminal domain-containing protein n=1 Tax=Geomicrobium sp. JCM 19039 TaxID=1460636 RepID=UPI00045F41B2|nr:adenine deaminase C-terminal domain-containing protein [Geomicrobium sp. JCM 19039]GAK12633.1 adenine deaminase [Geomicrobium sp. JCM 19039]
MHPHHSLWNKREKRNQISVVRGERAPSKVITNATFLNSGRKQWTTANIWIYADRIVYVGDALPTKTEGTEWTDAAGQWIVPGYIEHHAHPFIGYNPETFANYALERGTSTIFNDNLILMMNLEKKKALTLVTEMNKGPSSIYWSCRIDSQTETKDEHSVFTPQALEEWLNHPLVVQGGELTGWPKVISGDDTLLHWMEEVLKRNKRIEGHLPGASERTLAQLAILGVTSDHEAISGEEVLKRLDAGYTTTLRHSSLRPDLPLLVKEIVDAGITNFNRFLLTTDGGNPSFYEPGVMDQLLRIAIEGGIDPIAAYEMASYNVARHYGIDAHHGMIAPGRLAHLNFLEDVTNPAPVSVLAKGEWIVRDKELVYTNEPFPWSDYTKPWKPLNWDLQDDDLHFSMPMGIHLVNSVLLKPYHIDVDGAVDELSPDHDECFFAMFDKEGKWRMNTIIKGFASNLDGLATSYSITGDVVLIGKKKSAMKQAFEQLKEQGGGISIVQSEENVCNWKFPYYGVMSDQPMETLIEEHRAFENVMKEAGYSFDDPLYSIFFFSSTHLPYVRMTSKGIYDVHKKSVLFPTIMR